MATKKTIDLTKNTTSPTVNHYVKRMNKQFTTELKNSNIPVFMDLAKQMTLQSYFLDRGMYSFLLGEHLDLLDRMFKTAVCTIITEDITHAINDTKELKIVGYWDNYMIYNVIADIINLMKTDYDDKVYFTAVQYAVVSEEDLAKLPPATYMGFKDYNPNKFYQILMNLTEVTITTIMGMITAKIPKAFLHVVSGSNGLEIKLVNELGDFLKDDFDEGKLSEDPEYMGEKAVQHFVDYFEKPFMVYCTEMIKESGLSTNALSFMLEHTSIKVVYDMEGKTYRNTELTYNFMAKDIPNVKENDLVVQYTATIGDILSMVYDHNTTLSKSKATTLGRSIKNLIVDLCTFTETMFILVLKHNATDDGNVAAAEVLSDID